MSDPKVRITDLREKKRRGEKIAMLTAYDANMARLFDRAGVDVLLVGDSVGVVMLGYEDTLRVTLDDILHHTRAVDHVVEGEVVDFVFVRIQEGWCPRSLH